MRPGPADGEAAPPRPPTSAVLADMLASEAGGTVTLDGLMARVGERSFGVVLLVLAVLALLPGVSAVAALLLMVPAVQMLRARPGPVFPRRLGARPIAARRLEGLVRRAVPVLRWLERFIRPRWATPFEATKRVVGGVVLLLAVALLAPVPLSNLAPALAILLIAFAYLEEDGALLCAALAAAALMLAVAAGAAWEALSATGWVPGLF